MLFDKKITYYESLNRDEISFDNYWEGEKAIAEWKGEELMTEIGMDEDEFTFLSTKKN